MEDGIAALAMAFVWMAGFVWAAVRAAAASVGLSLVPEAATYKIVQRRSSVDYPQK